MKKKIIFKFPHFSSILSLRITCEISRFLFNSFFIIESWLSTENESFSKIITMKDKLELIFKERLIKHVNGIYLKHHLIKWS